MKSKRQICVLDPDTKELLCKKNDGTWEKFDMSGQMLSVGSAKAKKNALKDIVDKAKDCFDTGQCTEPIDVTMYSLKSCPHCVSHEKVLGNIERIFSDAGIPFKMQKKNAREHIDAFSSLGCNGTPCVSVRRNDIEEKLYEGDRSEVGAASYLLNIPNPLYFGKNEGKRGR